MSLIQRIHLLHPLYETLHIFNLQDDILAQDCCQFDSIETWIFLDLIERRKDITIPMLFRILFYLQLTLFVVLRELILILIQKVLIRKFNETLLLHASGMILIKVQHIIKVIEVDIISSKLEVLLIKEDLQLHKGSIFFPNSLINLGLDSINQLLLSLLRYRDLLWFSWWVYWINSLVEQ